MAGEELGFKVTADDEATDVLEGLGDTVSGIGSILGGIIATGVAAVAGALTALAGGLGLAISEAMQAQDLMAVTNAVIQSTGGIAGVAAEQVVELAGALSEVTRFSDDAVQAAENVMLRFTNIGETVFPAATAAALDIATALGTDAATAARLLGDALNAPQEGLGRLAQAGIQLTAIEEANIATLMAAGRAAEAQQIVLDAVARSVGGLAEAAGATASGQWEIFKNQMLNIAEGIGTSFLPALMEVGEMVGPVLLGAAEQIAPIFERIGGALGDFVNLLGTGMGPIDAFRIAFGSLLPPELQEQFNSFMLSFDDFANKLMAGDIAGALREFLPPELVTALMHLGQSFGELGAAIGATFRQIEVGGGEPVNVLQAIVDAIHIMAIGVSVLAQIWTAISPVIVFSINQVGDAVQALSDLWAQWGPVVIPTVVMVATTIAATLMELGTTLFSAGFQVFTFTMTMVDSFTSMVDAIRAQITQIPTIVATAIQSAIDRARTFIEGFFQVGRDFVAGLIRGVQSMISLFISTIVDAVVNAINAARAAAGAQSPATEGIALTTDIMEGMIVGVQRNVGRVAGVAAGATSTVIQSMQAAQSSAPVAAAGAGGPTIIFNYQPGVSLGNQDEAANILRPIIGELITERENS